ncbi:MAG: type II secretion system protein [Ignavibacteria bacterium GWA2_55_11]|nr:MAG: type II secretion system protein [Ignavibacteria bacterium GWA2_55_11]OGU45684.1 MAG: type II secretion system protein [Ignavibacteria bacterium GWC2_56_12]OGU67412.1 MAG: type II secretion system protein [Ignavibacteria bacterium RIFCSPHIGHO2_02_FULL_56_12]OGU70718.1 MAG: type II secretion system protein [Ignavibacteria bacterium RIFCSPLOWO2_12_FULL_56_21]OGU72296.1 MAG: type II secretion system protein [Ignavibacteria bacterium RIFCSPLOWO2_02_FULL_55_14]HAV24384.1 type II secretion s
MAEFRIDGLSPSGKVITGVISAENKKLAKHKAEEMARERKFKVTGVHERVTFLYRVQKGKEKPLDGEQKAFTDAEVRIALEKMGYKVMYVRRRLFGNKQKAAPPVEVISFVRISTDLMRQKLPFNEVMMLLINDIPNQTLRECIKEINTELKQGKDSEKVFQKHEVVLGKFTANMLGLASKSGNMVEIYESTAKFLERNAEFKRAVKQALVMPLVTLFVLFLAVMFYVAYIFPATAEMFVKFKIELPPMTKATLAFSYWLTANWIMVTIVILGPVIAFLRFIKTPKGEFLMDQYMIKIPVIGQLLHKTAIEIFCRVFYALYSGSGENIEVIRMAAEACGNKYMEHQIKTIAIPLMLEKGKGLTDAFEATGVFTETAISRLSSGAETGTVKNTAIQLAEYYEKETTYRLKNVVQMIELSVQMVIMIVLTGLTLVSSETATVKPKAPGGFLQLIASWF